MILKAKSLRKITAICVILISILALSADATVSVSITLFNSETTAHENIGVDNAKYESSAVLLPYTGFAEFPYGIHSDGAGSSTSSSGKFSHSVVAAKSRGDKKNVDVSVETQSGLFKWSKTLDASNDVSMGIGATTQISSGTIDASYSNSNSAEQKRVSTKNAGYQDKSHITPDSITSEGLGSSVDETGNGFYSNIEVQNLGKTVKIESLVDEKDSNTESADNKWYDGVRLETSGSSMVGSLSILSNDKCKLLPMVGLSDAGTIVAGMSLTPHYTNTGNNIFEVRTVPVDYSFMSFITVPKPSLQPANIKTLESATLSMIAKWR